MQIPLCPNSLEGKCARSDTVHGGETKDENADIIICRTCKLLWMISKPRTQDRARYENKIEKMKKASERDREAARRKLIFDYGRAR